MSLQPAASLGGPGPDSPPQQGRSAWFVVACAGIGCIVVALASGTHIGLALIALPIAVALVWQSPRTMIAVLPVWMVLLGVLRRLVAGGGNVTFSGDPLLIIGPLIIFLLFVLAVSRGALRERTRLANVVLFFSILAVLEAFNPKQGGVLTGLGGLLFVLVPMLAFWIGREMVDEVLALQLVRTIAVLSLLVAAYGLFQQFHGLPSWDARWIQSDGYTALSLGQGVIRAFGTFSSAQEYAAFLSVGFVAWLALARRETRWIGLFHLAGTATVGVAIWFESERTAVFLVVLAAGVMLAARLRWRAVGVFFAGIGAIVLLVVGGGHLGLSSGSSSTSVLSNHLVSGISGPFAADSSLPSHLHTTWIGILQAFKAPLGHGTGSVTIAASRYSHARTSGTEFDPGNMGIAFGLVGLATYVVLVWSAIRTAYRSTILDLGAVTLFALGMLMATLFQWTNGDLYSVCWLIWLFLGHVDTRLLRAETGRPAIDVATADPGAFVWRRPGEARRPLAST
jgi:hypothetical protein